MAHERADRLLLVLTGAFFLSIGRSRVVFPRYLLKLPLRQNRLKPIELEKGHWFDEPHGFIVIPEWYEISFARDHPDSEVARDLERLRSGEAGYRRGPRWRSTYLQQDFYAWLDPAYTVDLWQGEIGFTVYIRDPAAPPTADFGAPPVGPQPLSPSSAHAARAATPSP